MNSEYLFCEYEARDWTTLRYHLYNLKNWIYRGQSNYEWNLSTTIERSARLYNYDTRATLEKEKTILNKFQRRAHNYLKNLPSDESFLEWFSIIQHFGGPTRLLDFTYSFYVGAFFSVENSTSDSAIYCLNKNLINEVGKKRELERRSEIKAEFGTASYCDKVILEGRRSPLVMISEPQILNERMAAQQGVFGIPFEINQTFEYNLGNTMNNYKKELPISKRLKALKGNKKLLNENCLLLKIKIPQNLHSIIRQDLNLMNINAATLFPGLDGFARSLHLEFDIQETNDIIRLAEAVSKRLSN